MKRALFWVSPFLIASSAAAQAQPIAGGSDFAISPWRILASLLFCLALGAAAIFALRRRFGSASGGFRMPGSLASDQRKRIRVIEQQFLGPQRSISLIEIDGQAYAALFAAQTATLVAIGTDRESAAGPSPR